MAAQKLNNRTLIVPMRLKTKDFSCVKHLANALAAAWQKAPICSALSTGHD